MAFFAGLSSGVGKLLKSQSSTESLLTRSEESDKQEKEEPSAEGNSIPEQQETLTEEESPR